jgi:hypothetical protein
MKKKNSNIFQANGTVATTAGGGPLPPVVVSSPAIVEWMNEKQTTSTTNVAFWLTLPVAYACLWD